ncbi:histamine H2 receptor [Harmonia axyridis]|uniref:histamine H2 receptor n=1 Tax=Harmonia axyridis TaxID=115357 RepID=UPI001E27858F|nr:histamine H2 receptor [Harmonia axyridis]
MTQSLCNVPYTGSVLWLFVYTAIVLMSVVGNTLTILAILTSRKLQNLLSNRFVLSLAVSDLLVGCSVPYHMVPHYWPEIFRHRMPCLLRFSLIAFACASSIYNLLLVSADRYVAIVHPLHYSRCMTRRVSLVLISMVWAIGLGLGSCLLYWNHWNENGGVCDISLAPQVYLNYLLAPLFLVVWTVMLAFYVRIVKEAKDHAKRLKHAASVSSLPGLYEPSKSLQMVFVILGCFTVTWFPYFLCITIIKTKGKFCMLFYEISFWMAVGNSAMNPLIYAWKNHGFRQAFRYLLTCRLPDSAHADYITNHVPSNSKVNSIRIERGGYCNGSVGDLVKSERAASLVSCKPESDMDSEHTVVSELSVTGLYGAAFERLAKETYVDRL